MAADVCGRIARRASSASAFHKEVIRVAESLRVIATHYYLRQKNEILREIGYLLPRWLSSIVPNTRSGCEKQQ
jgi:hypothetical protein